MTTDTILHSDLAVPPGEYLEEVLEDIGMSKEDLARRMGRPPSKTSEIYKGAKAITAETALQLEQVLGVPAHIWIGLEAEYRLVLARRQRAEREEQLKGEAPLVAKFCYKALAKAGEVAETRSPIERVKALQRFFGVMSLKTVCETRRYQTAFRYGKAGDRSPEAVAAWLRLGECRARDIRCSPFDERRLRDTVSNLREMTLWEPERFRDALSGKLAESGFALVVCPHFPKTKAHGATFWTRKDKAVVMVTIRGKWADIFWFSLLHEIAHILLHGKQAVILEDGDDDERERDADRFAADTLIDPDAYRSFVKAGRFYEEDIRKFAKRMKVHPGIVVGRLQHEGRLKREWLNGLRVRYEWKEDN